jgi:hypothetical protein
MIRIVLNDEQARQIVGASQPIEVVDAQGRALGQIAPVSTPQSMRETISEDELAEVKQRMQSPGEYSTLQQIKDRLGWQDQQ